jgi:uncharacterized protein YbjT (DUF2867 family)
MAEPKKIVMLGASGAVGGQALRTLLTQSSVAQITVLVRRDLGLKVSLAGPHLDQQIVNVLDPASYQALLPGHHTALCTLGVGQPSKVSREQFLRVDRDAVLAFGKACKAAGVSHFSLLAAVGVSAQSSFFYAKAKGQLEDGLRALNFERLSLFEPSMILTPENRYGWSQALLLKLWPKLDALLQGPLRKYRGVKVEDLGRAMALDAVYPGSGENTLTWDQFQDLI